MQSLPRALAARGGFIVQGRSEVCAIGKSGDGWSVTLLGASETIDADAVVLATEPWVTATLLSPLHEGAARALAGIPCPPVTVVALGFGPDVRPQVPDGFGVLIARDEGFRMLGNLWETSLYPRRGPDGGILIRAMFGGAVDPAIGELSDDAMLALARDEVRRLYALRQEPHFAATVRVPRAIPQYERGHRDRVAKVEAALDGLPGLAVTGSGLRGVAFADAAADGVRTGRQVAAWIGGRQSVSVA
jgi:oxygen-dependent protoporphyrinogen oxidase